MNDKSLEIWKNKVPMSNPSTNSTFVTIKTVPR